MSEINDLFANQVSYHCTHITNDIELRISTLNNLKIWIKDHDDLITNALKTDLGKTPTESYMTEIGLVLDAIEYAKKNIKKFTKKQRVHTPLHEFFSRSYYINEAYGNVLIMAPWNYPFLLSIEPLVGAVAAGNCVILKPSEFAFETSAVIKQMVDTVFDAGHVAVVEGGSDVADELLKLNFDYIFFTGSEAVGKKVYEAAAKNLTPVTLELGGKSPAIVTESIPTDIAAKRILYGKGLNAGQTCVAPDYILVQESVKDAFMESIKKYITEFYGNKPLKSVNLGKIINKKHYERLKSLLKNQKVLVGGGIDERSLKIEPTFVDANFENVLMKEEIFGPIMPVITYSTIDEVIKYVNSKPKPLALYLFSNMKEEQERVTRECHFGGGCINDTVNHLSNHDLPFGGVGASGMGAYHGKYSLETFSHKKAIMHKGTRIDTPYRYYPFDEKKAKMIKRSVK